MSVNRKPGSVLIGHLSRLGVATKLKRLNDSSLAEQLCLRTIPLQQAGFTSSLRHRSELWALTLSFGFMKNPKPTLAFKS